MAARVPTGQAQSTPDGGDSAQVDAEARGMEDSGSRVAQTAGRAGTGGNAGSPSATTQPVTVAPAPTDAATPSQPAVPDASTPPVVRDASTPPVVRDASTPPVVQDAAMPSVPMTPDAATTPPPSRCRPGLYNGVFSGSVQAAGMVVANVFGSVSADLVLDPTGQYLDLRAAPVMGVDETGSFLTARLSGRVNCQGDQRVAGRLDGTFHHAQTDMDFGFAGTAEGTYTLDPPTILGTWSGQSEDNPLASADGAWSLTLSN